ncbi:hypothetical protein [uncultured Veillonella sp.]|uniref:hypothetical protein n=1 Tax=uncultured Veillonella sp. TaxID=159268 RepID=UPI0025DEB3B4|nr:hypothetical protein [uncultured Veillonella sp.]
MHEQSMQDVYMNAKRAGYLFFPYHSFIDYQGVVHEGRDKEAVASADFMDNEVAYTILVDTTSKARATAKQKLAVEDLLKLYPQANVMEFEGDIHEDKILQS